MVSFRPNGGQCRVNVVRRVRPLAGLSPFVGAETAAMWRLAFVVVLHCAVGAEARDGKSAAQPHLRADEPAKSTLLTVQSHLYPKTWPPWEVTPTKRKLRIGNKEVELTDEAFSYWVTFAGIFGSLFLWLCVAFLVSMFRKIPDQMALETGSTLPVMSGGSWKHGLCSCCGPGFGYFLKSFFCPCIQWAENVYTLRVLEWRQARCISFSLVSVVLFIFFVWTTVALVIASYPFDGDHSMTRSLVTYLTLAFLGAVAGVVWVWFSVAIAYFRQESRRKLGIWEDDQWEADFILNVCGCWPCAIAQEARHINEAQESGEHLVDVRPLLHIEFGKSNMPQRLKNLSARSS